MGSVLTPEQYNNLVDDIASAVSQGFSDADFSPSGGSQRDVERDATQRQRQRRRQQGQRRDFYGSEIVDMIEEAFGEFDQLPIVSQLQQIEKEFLGLTDDTMLRRMQELQNQFGGLAGGAGENFRRGTGFVNEYANAYIEFQERLAGVNQEGNERVRGLGVSLKAIVGDAKEAQGAIEAMSEGVRGSADGFRFASRVSAELVEEAAIFGERMDLNRSQITTFLSREIDLGRDAGEMLRTSAVFATRAAAITGDSGKEILNIIEALTKDTERYGNVSEVEMAQIGASLRVLGLDYQELNGMVDKFFSFDSAAQSVSALTTVFGVHLDAMEAMRLANSPDRMDFLNYVRDQFLATGKAAEDMTLAEQRLVQQQLGLSSVSAVTRLFDPTADLQSLEDLTAQTQMGAGDFEDAVKELEDQVRQFGTGTADTLDRLREASFDALRMGLQRDILAVATQIEELKGTLEIGAQGIGNLVREGTKLGEVYGESGQVMERFSGQQAEVQEEIIRGTRDMNQVAGELLDDMVERFGESVPFRDPQGNTPGENIHQDLTEALEITQQEIDERLVLMGNSFMTAFDGVAALEMYGTEILERHTGALGIAFESLSQTRREELARELDLAEEVAEDTLRKLFNDNLANTSERNLSREILRVLDQAQALSQGPGGADFLEGRIRRIAEDYNVSEQALRAGMAEGGGDIAEGGSDVIFRNLVDQRLDQSAAAPTAQTEGSTASADGVQALDGQLAELAAIRQALDKQNEEQKPINIVVEMAMVPADINLDGATIARSVINQIGNHNVDAGGNGVTFEVTTKG